MDSVDKASVPVVILCGGKGTRLREQTEQVPKPLVHVGNRPILWHIMKLYYKQGFRKFILLLGHKGEKIKEYFTHYAQYSNDFTLKQKNGKTHIEYLSEPKEDWEITFLDTGENTMTGGRIKQLSRLNLKSKLFMLTYGDGLADVNLNRALAEHIKSRKPITMTCVPPLARFGEVRRTHNGTLEFHEKPAISDSLINGGFFVVNTGLLKKLPEAPSTNFESEVLPELAREGKLNTTIHDGFWQCMDTLRDSELLNAYWESGEAPWKTWQ